MESKPDLPYRLQNIDTRIIHALILILILLPLLRPIGLPVQISAGTRAAYNAIEAIPAGSLVLWAYEMNAANEPELMPAAIAWFHHLMRKRCKIVAFSIYSEEAPIFAQKAFETVGKEYNYVYGEEFVVMPFRAGMETAVAAIGRDIHGVFPTDFFGNRTDTMPLMQEIKGLSDFAILLKTSGWGPDVFVRQMVTVYGIPMVANCTGIVAPGAMAYLSAGQIQGLVGALTGAAEYEQLLRRPGTAAAMMDAQSTTHMLTVILVLLGNVGFYASRRGPKGGR
ncbi:MAG: hypothetical protein Q8P31_09615 [Bacillota bacterium]|nr:hypothetical protein [Bacillota bacterium]